MDKPDYKESVRDYYVQNLAKLDVVDSFFEIKTDVLKKHCAPGDRVLAAGCGTGKIEFAIADLVGEIWGCDFTFDALQLFAERLYASDLNNIRLVNGDLTDLPFSEGGFDLLYSFSTLYYILEIDAVIRGFHEVLKEGGLAVLEFGNVLSLNAMHAVYRYNCPHFFLTLSTIDRVLRDNGFSVIDKRYFYFVPSFFFRGIARRLLHASIRGITLNEWLSSLPILRNFSCKILLVARKDRGSV